MDSKPLRIIFFVLLIHYMLDYDWFIIGSATTNLTIDVNLLCDSMIVFTASRKITLSCDWHWIWLCSVLVNSDYTL